MVRVKPAGTTRGKMARRVLQEAQDRLSPCWRNLLDALHSPPEKSAIQYNLAHFQGALDDVEYLISLEGQSASPATAQYLGEFRRRFKALQRTERSRLQRLGTLEMQDLLGRYLTYVSNLDDLLKAALRQGEVYSIVSVRNAIESLLHLSRSIRPSGAQVAEVLRLDRVLQQFIARVPWASWVSEDSAGEFSGWYAPRRCWWGGGPLLEQ